MSIEEAIIDDIINYENVKDRPVYLVDSLYPFAHFQESFNKIRPDVQPYEKLYEKFVFNRHVTGNLKPNKNIPSNFTVVGGDLDSIISDRPNILQISNIFLDYKESLAMVYYQIFCGGECGGGYLLIYKIKDNNVVLLKRLLVWVS